MTGPDLNLLKQALACKCPKCHEGNLYESRFNLNLREKCPSCGLDLAKNDSADGPAVFLIFVLGFVLVPLALILDANFTIPLWLHAIIWTFVALFMILGSLKPLKSYIIALQYKHLPWDNNNSE